MKYLIVKCVELNDQYECDADRTPICMTDNKEEYWKSGYEIYEVRSNGKLELIKENYVTGEEGFAVYYWSKNKNAEYDKPMVMKKWKNKKRKNFTLKEIEELKKTWCFTEKPAEAILREIKRSGSYGEQIGTRWFVIGEYYNNNFASGY